MRSANAWPELPLAEWKDTCDTLHMWTQIVGKIRLALTPLVNHWWNVPLYVTSRGLTTSVMPYNDRSLQINFDFIAHRLIIESSDGSTKSVALRPRSVASCLKCLYPSGLRLQKYLIDRQHSKKRIRMSICDVLLQVASKILKIW